MIQHRAEQRNLKTPGGQLSELIIEQRKKDDGAYELRYFSSNMPQDMPTLEMLRLFHERFWIEQGYQQLKKELGLEDGRNVSALFVLQSDGGAGNEN